MKKCLCLFLCMVARQCYGERRRSRVRAVQMDYRGILRWFSHVERNRIAKRVYVEVCVSSHSVGRPRRRWIDIVKECLKKSGLDIKQARRMVQDRDEWQGFVRGNAWGVARGMNP